MPSAMARTLSGGRSGLVGLVLGASENPFYAELMHEAVSQAAERGLRLLLFARGRWPDRGPHRRSFCCTTRSMAASLPPPSCRPVRR